MVISLNKPVLAVSIAAVVLAVSMVPLLSEDLADAKSTKKIHFTETFVSSQDPGRGHEGHQLALLLSPEEGIIYDGSVTYAADKSVQILVLHEIGADESKGQPVWTVDGKALYALSIVDAGGASGSYEFTGAALGLYSPEPEPFAATASVDGWIRGGALEFITKTIEVRQEPRPVELYREKAEASIPMHSGMYNESRVHYIITDSSDESLADEISQKQGWTVQTAPPLSEVPESILGEVYFFTNGLGGDGLHGFQDEILSDTPGQPDVYTALREAVNVSWKPGQNPGALGSVEDILQAEKNGRVEVQRTGAVLNAPQIVWPDGRMPVRDGGIDGASYDGGQVLEIDEEAGTVTFVAHRAWGPDGGTIYHIITDATPSRPAETMGVIDVPTSAGLLTGPAVSDMYQFKNGLAGAGSLGFQPGIAASVPGDKTYSPMWRTLVVEWSGPGAYLLDTVHDINGTRADDLVIISTARPLNSDHVINGPVVDPFQNKG